MTDAEIELRVDRAVIRGSRGPSTVLLFAACSGVGAILSHADIHADRWEAWAIWGLMGVAGVSESLGRAWSAWRLSRRSEAEDFDLDAWPD
jgi:hypothetical protein